MNVLLDINVVSDRELVHISCRPRGVSHDAVLSFRSPSFADIEKAAKHYGAFGDTWHEFGVHPRRHRKEAAAEVAAMAFGTRGDAGNIRAHTSVTKHMTFVIMASL